MTDIIKRTINIMDNRNMQEGKMKMCKFFLMQDDKTNISRFNLKFCYVENQTQSQ